MVKVKMIKVKMIKVKMIKVKVKIQMKGRRVEMTRWMRMTKAVKN